MINYPTKKGTYVSNKTNNMANQGMALEDMINRTNDYYRIHSIALVNKRPTPVKVLKTVDNYKIVDGVFVSSSSLDYVGVCDGFYLDFEAKETISKKGFPMANIAMHQIEAMEDILKQNGITFAIIFLKAFNEIYLIDAKDIIYFAKNHKTYIDYEKIKEIGTIIPEGYLAPVDYIKVVKEKYFNK